MYGAHKKFNKTLHNSNDPQSRKIVKEYLKKQGIVVEDNPNQYGIDLLSPDGTLQIEVEHRLVWIDDDFPYDEINVPERKAKFLKEGKTQYIILSRDFSHMGIIRGPEVQPYIVDENLALSRNKYVKNNEYFFKIPKDKFTWVKI